MGFLSGLWAQVISVRVSLSAHALDNVRRKTFRKDYNPRELQFIPMMRLTAYISGRVQRVGFRAKAVALATKMCLVGMVQNRPDGKVLVIAEGEKAELERFAEALRIENTYIHVQDISIEFSPGLGEFSNFRKISGPDEIGERLDDGIEILKQMASSLNRLEKKMDQSLDKQDQMLDKQDQMLDKQETTIEEISGQRNDLKTYMDMRFERIETDLTELKEMKTALKEKGFI
jgi:acylphosphatase